MNPTAKTVRIALMTTVFLMMAAAQAAAFSLSPMSASLAPSGPQSVASFKVQNETDQPIAVALKVATRSVDQYGVETNTAVDKEFLVFPARVVLQPKSSQVVKLQYKGNANISTEVPYRFIAEQLPVDFSKAQSSGVQVMFRYVAALYVTPKNVSASPVLVSVVGGELNGVRGLNVTLKNEGTRHALLIDPVLRIQESSKGAPVTLSGDTLTIIDGQNILPAGTRIFFVPWEAAMMGATYEGAFNAEIE